MPRNLVLAAAVATALAVAGCGSASLAQTPPPASQSQSAAEPLAAGGAQATEADQAAGAEQAAAEHAESGQADAGAGDAESSELQASARGTDAALQVDTSQPGLPIASGASIDDVLRLGAVGTWIDAPGVLAISLPATDQCWPAAMVPVVESPTRLVVEFTGAAECGVPDGARTYMVQVPDGIDAGADLEVELRGLAYDFTLQLPAE